LKKQSIIFVLYLLLSFGCSKPRDKESCSCTSANTESVEKIFGIVVNTRDGFEILTDEKGLLIPCGELAGNFKDAQPVTISGSLKNPIKKIAYDFDITPINISEIKLRDSNYNKKDISLTIIKSEDYGYAPGFGYHIKDNRDPHGTEILQPHLPAISGIVPFSTKDKAIKTGILVIHLLRKNPPLGSLSQEILDYTRIIQ
jgi:hypothetical protein